MLPTLWRENASLLYRAALLLLLLTTLASLLFCLRAVLYPYEADTMEGNILLQGVSAWTDPSLLYPDPERARAVSYIFPPLVGFVYGSIYRFTGRVLLYPRLLNFGVLFAAGLLFTRLLNLNRLQAVVVFCSWICLQVFFCGYLCSIRVDATLAFLSALACLLFRRYLERERTAYLAGCGVALCGAILTKQHGLFILAALTLTLLWRTQIKAASILTGIALAPVVCLSVWLNGITHGWYARTLSINAHRFSFGFSFGALAAITSSAIPFTIIACAVIAYREFIAGHPTRESRDVWLYVVGICYLPIACAGVMQGGIGSVDNFAFFLGLLLPIVARRFVTGPTPLMICALLFFLSAPYFGKFRPFATWLVYAPNDAREVVREIESTRGNVLLSRRQEFLLRTGREVLDDLGDMYFEFVPAGYTKVQERINREIRAGKYELIMLEAGEIYWLEPETQAWLSTHYSLSSDPRRALFRDRFTRKELTDPPRGKASPVHQYP